jgi:hypothetical protein
MQVVMRAIVRARQLIEAAGWVRGSLCSEDGYCIVGALVASEQDEGVRWLALECIRAECGCELVTRWNDHIAKSKKEVVKILIRAESRASKLLAPRQPRIAGPDRSTIYS